MSNICDFINTPESVVPFTISKGDVCHSNCCGRGWFDTDDERGYLCIKNKNKYRYIQGAGSQCEPVTPASAKISLDTNKSRKVWVGVF